MNSKIFLNILCLCCISFLAQAQDKYEVENFTKVNSSHLDFSPIPYKNGIIFTSTRDSSCECQDANTKANPRGGLVAQKGLFKKRVDAAMDNYTDLYFADFSANDIKKLKGDLNGIHHDGVATVLGNALYISRTNQKGRRTDRIKDSKIYKLKGENIDWNNKAEVQFNSNDWATCHPSITADGKKLFFASSRPGGFGGMDIWVVQRIGEGWSEPRNLGSKVNTAKNELFPYISAANELFFASNGHEGALGLDIFKATENDFSKITRLAEPINSENDDFGFAMNSDGTSGYLSSDRAGGKGGDDIYKWVFKKAEIRAISVIDAIDKSMIKAPTVSISAPGIETINSSIEDIVSITPDPETTYTIVINKGGYDSKTITVSGADLLASPEYKVPIEKAKPLGYLTKVIVKSSTTQELLPNAKLKIVKSCNGNVSEQIADANAAAEIFVECNCSFTVTAMQNGYDEGTSTFNGADCSKPAPTTALVVELAPKKVYKQGDLITLKDIYYDYDRSEIRADAALILDELVAIMLKYPSMEIDFGSHTDSRGSDIYNKNLSQRRTDAAKVYLVSKGVAANRVIASGYGEDRLLNRCKNGVKCNDEEHQLNRRTEVRVTKISEENVEVRKN